MASNTLAQTRVPATSSGSDMGSKSKLQQMLNEDLIDISASWEDFGVAVGIGLERIEKIRTEYTGKKDLTSHCFKRVINAWLCQGDVSKDKLVKALRHTSHGNLAKKVNDQEIELNLQSLCTLLEEVYYNYSEFGIFLGVPNKTIKKFEVQRGNADLCLLDVISDWFEMEGENAPSKEGLKKALEFVSRKNLAKDLEEKYKDWTFPGDEDLNMDTT